MELYINNTLVDLEKSIPFPLTYQIGDIRDIEKRRGNRSKTIKVIGSRVNVKLFSTVFHLSTASAEGITAPVMYDFDPSKKAPARYYENGLLIFSGVAQLTECVKDKNVWEFSIVLLSDTIDYLSSFKNIKIRELGWSEYNHDLTYANQQDSWAGTIQKNAAPYSNITVGQWLGEGYYYGLIDYGYDRPGMPTVNSNFEVIHIPPQIFLKSILDKMFENSALSYTSTFFGSQLFKKCLMAYEGGLLPNIDATISAEKSVETDQINDSVTGKLIDVTTNGSASATTTYVFPDQLQWHIDYNDDTATDVDPGGHLQSHIPTRFIPSAEGLYNISYSGDHDVTVDLTVNDLGTGTPLMHTAMGCILEVYINNAFYNQHTVWLHEIAETATLSHTFTSTFDVDFDLYLDVSDEVTYNLSYLFGTDIHGMTSSSVDFDYSVTATGCELDMTYAIQTILAGSTINIQSFLPKMDGATFFKGIINMFNLYVQPDPLDNTNLLIEPLNTFYNGSANALNWTQKLDPERPIKVTPTINFSTKEYIFKFQDDKDYWNERYFSDVTEQYGSKILNSSSQFATGKTEIKLPFSNKLLGEIPTTNLTVPRNFTVKTDQSGVSEITPKKGKPFIVQIKPGNVITGDNMQAGDWNHIDETDTDNIQTEYPYVGHLDDIDSPSFDLMFGLPSYVFYDLPAGITYTTNNLYLYHEKFIKEILDKNGKMLTAYMNLTPTDINQLDFGDLINIHGVVYRLNKIENYDSKEQKSTKCEFIKIIEGESIQTNTVTELTPGLENFDPFEIPSIANLRIVEDKGAKRITDDNFKRETEN